MIRNAWRSRFAQVSPSVAHTLMRRYVFNHQKSVGCIFSCSLGLLVLCLSASLLRLALLSGHLFFGAENSENCLSRFSSKREVGSAGSINILITGFGA
ncbi:TPA: hypothetical protein I7683_22070 [Vibrio vulnificus]|nr:hypothetical protein [Vibrio vulnificus]